MKLQLTQEWDKTFPKSDKVDHKKVTFKNRYGIELAADMYTPKNAEGKLPAIAVTGPFGAVKEQSSGLYAQHMAERGFLTIAFDPSFTGESGGEPRRMASPDINTEDFLAAVDFLSVQDNVDSERSGNSTDGWNATGCQSFLNQPILDYANEIESPVLLIHGEKAHSRYFSEYAFEKMTGKKPFDSSVAECAKANEILTGKYAGSYKEGNKELLIISGASHVDLYDDVAGVIPYDKMEAFFKDALYIKF